MTRRIRRGFGYGVVATIVMSIPMLLATVSGLSPMPEPVPKAIVGQLVGSGVPKPAMMALAIGLHLGYGGVFGAVLARSVSRVTLGRGLALGIALWVLMQVAILPWIGWGPFGTAHTPRIAVATLVLHLVYGSVLGWTVDKEGSIPFEGTATASD